MKNLPVFFLAALLTAPIRPVHARIESLTLEGMLARTDNAVYGEIVARHTFHVDELEGGPGLYFTTLTLEGRSLHDGVAITVDVTFHGGFVDERNGVYDSEAPSLDDTRVGTRVVAFYKWLDDMGGGVAGNVLYASHGGLFRTVSGPQGAVVLGRGGGYAVHRNLRCTTLGSAIRTIRNDR